MDAPDDRGLTWAALLARWAALARSAVALPDDGEGGRVRRAVPDLIGLHAITHALAEADVLPDDERAAGLDLAEVGIRRHAGSVHAIWGGEPLLPAVREIIEDALAALRAAAEGGLEWVVEDGPLLCPHPAGLVDALLATGFRGDLYVPTPGVPLFDESPAAFARGPRGLSVSPEQSAAVLSFLEAVGEPSRRPFPRQVYRQFDFGRGGPVRDLVRPMDAELPAGQPLLVPALLAGEPCAVTLPIAGADRQGLLPVVFEQDWSEDGPG